MKKKTIVAVGEVLWDSLPEGIFLGGATFNAAYHLNALGHESLLLSSVGHDTLGVEVVRRMRRAEMSREALQRSDAPTGLVLVEVDGQGVPSYEIVENVAWDDVRLDSSATAAIARADVVLFGSLAQRKKTTRETIRATWGGDAIKCFDVNLRAPYDDRDVVLESLEVSNIVKLNDDELLRLAGWLDVEAPSIDDARRLMELARDRFGIDVLCVTRGPNGALALAGDSFAEHPGSRST